MLNAVLNNLINIGWAMLIFLCAYLSNVAFSLYYNIKVLVHHPCHVRYSCYAQSI